MNSFSVHMVSVVLGVVALLFTAIVLFPRTNKINPSVTNEAQLIYSLFEVGREYEFTEIEDFAYDDFGLEGERIFNLLQELVVKRKIIKMHVVKQKYKVLTTSGEDSTPPQNCVCAAPVVFKNTLLWRGVFLLRWYDKNMKIATYNVRNLYDPGTKVDDTALDAVSESFFNKRIAYFTEQLQKLDLDIICFQEIGGELGVKVIAEALNCDYFCARPNKRGIRMAVIYKKDLSSNVSCESISFGDLPIPSIQVSGDAEVLTPIAQRRDILEITLTVNGKIISINTFHLKSNLPQYLENDDIENDKSAYIDAKFRCLFYKTMELCAIRRHADKRLAEGKEVVLLGDYNETNIASILDILTGSQNREVIEYHDLLVGYEGDATTHLYRGKKLVFDTIIASSGIKNAAKDIVVENTTLKDYSALPQGAIEHEVESDHALVFVDISL